MGNAFNVARGAWEHVYDHTLLAAVAAIDIPLPTDLNLFRLLAIINPVATGTNFELFGRVSVDGVTYFAGASDYFRQWAIAVNATPAAAQGTYSGLSLSGSVDESTTGVSAVSHGLFFKGSSVSRPRAFIDTAYFENPNYGTGQIQSSYATNVLVNYLRLLTNTGLAQLGIGTRIILEGK
jgi:hypothetical protein